MSSPDPLDWEDAEADPLDDTNDETVPQDSVWDESYTEDDPGLWDGDKGTLDRGQRDAVVALMKKAFISSDDRAEWVTLTRTPGPIAATLNNVYLKLVIDDRAEVAYTVPARTADEPFKTLVRDAPNSREETLLLIFLREQYRSSTAGGQTSTFVDSIAMYDYVQRFRPASATDRVGDEKRVKNAIIALVSTGLLVKTRDEDRYRVHRAIEALLPLDRLNQLLAAFRNTSGNTAADEEAGYSGRHAAPETVDVDEDDESIGATDPHSEDNP
jgi:hypothetical protein